MHTLARNLPSASARLRGLASAARQLGLAALVLLVLLLQACGGGAGGDAEQPPPAAPLPDLSGRVMNGSNPTDVRSLQVTVKGSVGTARTAEGRLAPVDGSDYLASLDQLSGPYLITDSAAASAFGLYSVATRPGTANLTPLTTLLVAELLGTEPGAYFAALGTRGGFTAADDASIAAAEQRVRRYLQREFSFVVPASIGNFITTPFSRTAGDPMFDTLNALVARIGTDGDYSAVVSAVAQESGRCKAERVSVVGMAATDDFCPFSKSNAAAPNNSAVRVLAFSNRRGDTLRLRMRGTVVLNLVLTTAEGADSRCAGAACTGLVVGTPAGDQTQLITLADTPLSGADGTVRLTGSLRSAVPGIELPGLPCTDNRFFFIDEVARRAEGFCAMPDEFGLGAAGQSTTSGATRRKFTFDDGAGGPALEVVVQGGTVVSALVYTTDPESGVATAQFQCRGAACTGISLGASTVNRSLGVPIVLQPIRFERAVLSKVLPDASASATARITVEAGLTGYFVDDPGTLPFTPLGCPAGAPTVSVRPSDASAALPVCEPSDTQGFELRSTTVDAEGNLVLGIASLLTDGADNFVSGNSVTVTISPAGAVLSAAFDALIGPHYRCSGPACAGISVSAANGRGERTVSFTSATLTEVGTTGLAADRSAVLNGSFVAPAVGP